jgi:hypothetical protein
LLECRWKKKKSPPNVSAGVTVLSAELKKNVQKPCKKLKTANFFSCYFEHTLLPNMDPSKWIDVTPEKFNYHLDHFVIPTHYEKDVSSILIPHGVIMVKRVFRSL